MQYDSGESGRAVVHLLQPFIQQKTQFELKSTAGQSARRPLGKSVGAPFRQSEDTFIKKVVSGYFEAISSEVSKRLQDYLDDDFNLWEDPLEYFKSKFAHVHLASCLEAPAKPKPSRSANRRGDSDIWDDLNLLIPAN